MRLAPAGTVGAALMMALSPGATLGQSTTELNLTPDCTECVVVVEQLLELGMQDEAVGPLSSAMAAARDARGRVWIAYGSQAPIQRFDPSGAVVDTPRRAGEGPGEFVSPTVLLPIGDSMAVFDQRQSRMTLLAADFSLVRTVSIPSGTIRNAAVVDWPLVVVNASFHSPTQAGYPYHLLDLGTGELEASFGGSSDGSFSDRTRFRLRGHVAVDTVRREIWTAALGKLRVDRWSYEGTLVGSLSAAPDWFRGVDRAVSIGTPNVAPDPLITSLQVNTEGVWLVLRMPAEEWRAAWGDLEGDSRGPHGLSPAGMPEMSDLFRGRLLLLDPETMALGAMGDLEVSATGGPLAGAAGFYEFTNTAGLYPGLRIHEYQLLRR